MSITNSPGRIETIQDIRDAFTNGEITAVETAEYISEASIKKPWHTTEWNNRRKGLIGDTCTQCGSREQPMVLQHMWHPRKLSIINGEIRYRLRPEYEQTHPLPELTPPAPEAEKEGCPNCHRFSFYWRKTTEDWRCGNQNCKHVFKVPVLIPVLSYEQAVVWNELVNRTQEEWKREFRDAIEERSLAEALPIAFAEHDRYVSLVDTTTFCKKCAFMWDINKKKLCSQCKSYIPTYIDESSCFKCLDEGYGAGLRYIESLYAAEDSKNKDKHKATQ
jgi:hypothetical protein